MSSRRVPVGVVCDLKEENWPSMDLVAEMLLQTLAGECGNRFQPQALRTTMRRRFSMLPGLRATRAAQNADRLAARFWDYPRYLSRVRSDFQVFHIVDHSYAHLVHELPAERTVVTCHDLDTFRCLLEPEAEPRGTLFQSMTRRILTGFQKAAHITCDSEYTRSEVLRHKLAPLERLSVVPNGVHPACSPEPDEESDARVVQTLGPVRPGCIDLLHVGSVIPRKRVDTLLQVFALVRREIPEVRLIRVGGALTTEQGELARDLGIASSILTLPRLESRALASVYRRSSALLQTSEREGFGLPVVEAMACGCPVAASDIPVLRETGGEAAVYSPVGDAPAWSAAVLRLLADRGRFVEASVRQASRFSWPSYARRMAAIYEGLLA